MNDVMPQRLFIFAFLTAAAVIMSCSGCHGRTDSSHAVRKVNITIYDDAPYHVHPAGKPFTIAARVDYTGPTVIHYQWQDFRGRPLSDPGIIKAGESSTIQSPSSKVGPV